MVGKCDARRESVKVSGGGTRSEKEVKRGGEREGDHPSVPKQRQWDGILLDRMSRLHSFRLAMFWGAGGWHTQGKKSDWGTDAIARPPDPCRTLHRDHASRQGMQDGSANHS